MYVVNQSCKCIDHASAHIDQKYSNQERLRQQAIKEQEKERLMFYQKQKGSQKDVRSKYREKVYFSILLSAHIAR